MHQMEVFKSASANCTKCNLSKTRKTIVYPDILQNSTDNWTTFVIGEAPGKQEDETGKPFVGRSGKLLREKLSRLPGKIVITNTVKCRPPNNRDPKKEELMQCREHLEKEIGYYKPNLFILVGRFATFSFLEDLKKEKLLKISGMIYNKMIPLIHPAATLYNAKQRSIWEESWTNIYKYIETEKLNLIKPKNRNTPLTNFLKLKN